MKDLTRAELLVLAILVTLLLNLFVTYQIGREFHGFVENIKLTLHPK